ncbi:MAG: NAD(P)-dependent glycerol-3-phosphate dehydrogenase [Actinomycetota bacterium]|nr:NAD(P)-dependent glycerol-3-phosphate dehydrogenase [Actinomycetota bacterium]
MKYAVIGAGSWGTAVASLIASSVETVVWSRNVDVATDINDNNRNSAYLDGFDLPTSIRATTEITDAVADADVVVMAVPSHGYRGVLDSCAQHIGPSTPVLSLAKGIEQDTLMRMTEVTLDVLQAHDPMVVGVLTGPNLAREIMQGQPAATVIALGDHATATEMQRVFMGSTFRVYTNPDVVGSEIAGAVKNVMAIASGMAAGKGFGDNTLATLITRALVEMTRLGVAVGGDVRTFPGLAGLGDLIATCNSSQSRNHIVGFGLGQGRTLDEITSEMNMVAEGIKSTSGILELAQRHGVDMPIARQVGRVLYDGLDPTKALTELMTREAKSEFGS